MRVHNDKQYNVDPILGTPVEVLWGTVAPEATSFFTAPEEGSIYIRTSAEEPIIYRKVKDDNAANDWVGAGLQCISQTFAVGDFTDGGSTAGTLVLTPDLPARSWVLRALLSDVTGFTGDTSATITVGDGTDADRYNTGTPSVFTTAAAIDLGAPSGTQLHTAEMSTITLTVTSNSDFGAVSAGAGTITIWYLLV